MVLTLNDYQTAIALDEPFIPDILPDRDQYPVLVADLLTFFRMEAGRALETPSTLAEQREVFKALLTVRPPDPIHASIWSQLDQLFQFEAQARTPVSVTSLPVLAEQIPSSGYPFAENTVLWQGDISLLSADAITNAANSAMLGCFEPFHACIDNVIHSCAGPRLRDDCNKIMELQGHPEEFGNAKLTRAYHLPSRYVAHTVGPFVGGGMPDVVQEQQLANCYESILTVCSQKGDIHSVAFCCISTGVFGYPQLNAARVAIDAVANWRSQNEDSCIDTVIFNVYRDDDLQIYKSLFEMC